MSFIQNWMRDDILALNSYKVQGSDNKLKLDAMESPFSLSENTQNELADKLKSAEINRYPANHLNLKNTIKDLMDIPQELEVMLGNGSDELIQLLMLGCENSDKILGFNPSFVMYEMIAKWCKLDFLSIDLDNDFDNNFDIDLRYCFTKNRARKSKNYFYRLSK
jgi:histidinol-phosphate aminotransferase